MLYKGQSQLARQHVRTCMGQCSITHITNVHVHAIIHFDHTSSTLHVYLIPTSPLSNPSSSTVSLSRSLSSKE